jgi:hypothetical protein
VTAMITTITTIQAQYYSHMDIAHEDVGWTSVDMEEDHHTIDLAMTAIADHCKRYGVDTKQRKFRIVTTVSTVIVMEVK